MLECDNCKKELPKEGYWDLVGPGGESVSWLCSPSCLVEEAWRIKEGQTKLSKSKKA